MFRISLLWSVALFAALLLRAADGPDPEDAELSDFAPTSDFVVLYPGQIVAVPDFTGLPPWTLEEPSPRDMDGPGDRDKSNWHREPGTLPERPIGDADYLRSGNSKGHLNSAASHTSTQAAVDATHSYWNCVPQNQQMNAQVW